MLCEAEEDSVTQSNHDVDAGLSRARDPRFKLQQIRPIDPAQ